MITDNQKLIDQIAEHAAEFAVLRWASRLNERQQRRWRRRFFDSARASLFAFEGITKAQSIRARALASEN